MTPRGASVITLDAIGQYVRETHLPRSVQVLQYLQTNVLGLDYEREIVGTSNDQRLAHGLVVSVQQACWQFGQLAWHASAHNCNAHRHVMSRCTVTTRRPSRIGIMCIP